MEPCSIALPVEGCEAHPVPRYPSYAATLVTNSSTLLLSSTDLDEKVLLSEGVFPDMDDSRTIGGIKRGYASLRRMIS